jgi:hypothetical protein
MTSLIDQPSWIRSLDWFFVSRAAPISDEELVVARCGPYVLGLARADGALRWQTEIEPKGGDEHFFLARPGGGWVTDVQRASERLTSVVALAPDGSVAWRADLPVIGGSRGAFAGGRLVLPGAAPAGGGQRLIVLDDRGGFEDVALAWGAGSVVDGGSGRVVVANPMSKDLGRGLYRVGLDGSDPTILAAPAAFDVAGGGALVAATLAEADGTCVAAIEVERGARRWSAPVSARWLAVAGERVIAIEDRRPVCRTLGDGAVVWTGEPLDGDVSNLSCTAGVISVGHGRTRTLVDLADGVAIGTVPSRVGPAGADGDALYVAGHGAVRALRRPVS